MTLLTKEIKRMLPRLYSQEHSKDPEVFCKFFTPDGNYTWYVTEGEVIYQDYQAVDYEFFGLIQGQFEELGYFRLSELEKVRGRLGLPVERDKSFKPCLLSTVRRAQTVSVANQEAG